MHTAAEEAGVERRGTQFCSLTYFSVLGDWTRVDLEDVQTSLFIGQFDICRTQEDFRFAARGHTERLTNR